MTRNMQQSLHIEAFQTIVEQSPISTQIFNKDGKTIFVNEAWERLWQVRPEDILHSYNILEDQQLEEKELMPFIKEAFDGKKNELPVIHYQANKTFSHLPEVTHRFVGAIIYPLKDKKGLVTHVVLQHYDVTDTYETQKKLQETELKFRTLFEANIIGMFISDLDGRFLEANDAFLSMVGYTKKDLEKGRIHRDILTPPEFNALSDMAVDSLLTSGKTTTYEKEYVRKNGTKFPVLLAVVRIDTTDTCLGFALDITDRKKSEEANFRLAALVNSSDDAIISKTLGSVIMTWNQGAEDLFGFTAEEAIGKSIMIIIPNYLQDEEKDIIARIKRGERIRHYRTERMTKGGKILSVSVTFSPIIDDKGKIIGVSNITRDITEQIRIEQEKSDFLSMASHELKTPLTSMKMFIELLGRMLDPTELDKAKYFVNRVHDQTNQLVELTNDLLDVSRIETGKLRLNIEEFHLDALVRETVEAITTSTRTHKLILKDTTPLPIHADRYRIFQVLINLLTNAIKYSPAGKDIVISVEKNHQSAIVHVQDFGIGISKGHLEKIFDRLYQVNEPKEKTYPGLGLGLYISKEIVSRHEGKIWVESAKGKGSIFSFTLPLDKGDKN